VISSIVSRIDPVLVEMSLGPVAPVSFLPSLRLGLAIGGPIFVRAGLFAAAGGLLAGNTKIDDFTHELVPDRP
jgi:hypothetical protein